MSIQAIIPLDNFFVYISTLTVVGLVTLWLARPLMQTFTSVWKHRTELYRQARLEAERIVHRVVNAEPLQIVHLDDFVPGHAGHDAMTERWIAHRAEGLPLEGNVAKIVGDGFDTRSEALHRISHMVMDVAATNNAFTLQELEQLVRSNELLLLLVYVTYSACAHILDPACKVHFVEILNAKLQHASLNDIDVFLQFLESTHCTDVHLPDVPHFSMARNMSLDTYYQEMCTGSAPTPPYTVDELYNTIRKHVRCHQTMDIPNTPEATEACIRILREWSAATFAWLAVDGPLYLNEKTAVTSLLLGITHQAGVPITNFLTASNVLPYECIICLNDVSGVGMMCSSAKHGLCFSCSSKQGSVCPFCRTKSLTRIVVGNAGLKDNASRL